MKLILCVVQLHERGGTKFIYQPASLPCFRNHDGGSEKSQSITKLKQHPGTISISCLMIWYHSLKKRDGNRMMEGKSHGKSFIAMLQEVMWYIVGHHETLEACSCSIPKDIIFRKKQTLKACSC